MDGLPERTRAVLFDLDGVLTATADVHAAAWQEMFDEFLRQRSGPPVAPFDPVDDYARFVDGRVREDGTRAFLAARDIHIPEGIPDDPPEAVTVHGLSARKEELFQRRLRRDGAAVYPGSVRFLTAVREAGLGTAVVSASRHCEQIVASAGLAHLLDARVDGIDATRDHLTGKPAPDTYLAAAARLGVDPPEAAVAEDALAGVTAGRAGGFGYVIGIDRLGGGHGSALSAAGADVVVTDLDRLLS